MNGQIKRGELYYSESRNEYLKIGDQLIRNRSDIFHAYRLFEQKSFNSNASVIPSNDNDAIASSKDLINFMFHHDYRLVSALQEKEEYSVSSGLFDIDDL